MTPEQSIRKVCEDFPFPGYIDTPRIRGAFRTACELIPPHVPVGSKILDFGCGPADNTAVVAQLGYDCHGADDLNDPWHRKGDNRQKILDFAKSHGVTYHVIQVGAPFPWPDEYFDMVMLNGVIEHLHDSPRDLLNALLKKVRPEGFLCVSVPNAGNLKKRIKLLMGKTNMPDYGQFYWSDNPWRGHVREYVRGDLQRLAEFLNLDILELTGRHHMLGRLPAPLQPFWFAATKVFNGWRDAWFMLARKRPGWEPVVELSEDDPIYKMIHRLDFDDQAASA